MWLRLRRLGGVSLAVIASFVFTSSVFATLPAAGERGDDFRGGQGFEVGGRSWTTRVAICLWAWGEYSGSPWGKRGGTPRVHKLWV
jgi:hypothetical protein